VTFEPSFLRVHAENMFSGKRSFEGQQLCLGGQEEGFYWSANKEVDEAETYNMCRCKCRFSSLL